MTVSAPITVSEIQRVEQNDPGAESAAWWLGVPIVVAIVLVAIAAWDVDFYLKWVQPEATGGLEISHVIVPLIALFVALGILTVPAVRAKSLLKWIVGLFALACLYIAGEEASWGQWYFHWETPDYWSEINIQNETNLHNTSFYFNDLPRHMLKFAILVGGIILPLMPMRMRGPFATNAYLRLLTPPKAIVPVAFGAFAFNLMASLTKKSGFDFIIPRPSEVTELFMYLFILFYLLMFRRRVTAL